MWLKGVRLTVVFGLLFTAACGAKTDDSADGGPVGSGSGTAGSGTAGSSGTGGNGTGGNGTGEGGPSGPYVTNATSTSVTKLDLLFMIDNSSSMSDKQAILSRVVPDLVSRFIDPGCIDPATGRTVGAPVNGVCTVGNVAFAPLKDIHIGILSSSLGSHGAGSSVCDDAYDSMLGRADPHNDDRGHLISRGVGGTNVPTYQSKGFLYYNPSVSGGLASASAVATPFTSMVQGVGQHGCGYEASLESAYRFLVDPEPYDTIKIDTRTGGYGVAVLNGTDAALLQQRKDFLRPDSLVSIVLVSDENDCSTIDGGQGFYALLPPITGSGKTVLPRGTAACLANPNDKCCFPCGTTPPGGCAQSDTDVECSKGQLSLLEDQPNLRCFNQKKRYGADFLYPVQRYVDGFTRDTIQNRKGEMVANPLFADLTCTSANCTTRRAKSLVWVGALTGVPWQDLAVDRSDLSKGYKTSQQLADEGIWADIVGDPANPAGPVAPRDVHMIESIAPRMGLPGPGSLPSADTINGHEWDPSKDQAQPNADLQYACTFDLIPPRTCTGDTDCDCFGQNLADVKNPLCQSANGAYTTTQVRAKAYPSTRILQVLQGIGAQTALGSICPAQGTDRTRDDFEYTPFVNHLVAQFGQPLRRQCLPVALPVDATTLKVPCSVIEVFDSDPSTCACDTEPGRRTAPAALLTAEMKTQGSCRCEILQLGGSAQRLCQTSLNVPPGTGDGWCYVDPGQAGDTQSCVVVRECASSQKRLVHFLNTNSEPRPGSTSYLRCDAQPITPTPSSCP